eukprot:scaffold318998_cov18-Tisochrysis_lutea.AAC.1
MPLEGVAVPGAFVCPRLDGWPAVGVLEHMCQCVGASADGVCCFLLAQVSLRQRKHCLQRELRQVSPNLVHALWAADDQ